MIDTSLALFEITAKTDAEWLRQDSDLDNIRNDPRFQEVVERLEAREAQQAEPGPP